MSNKKQNKTSKKECEKWVKIGMVGVDSGTLMIADPCYVEGDDWCEKDYQKWIVNTSDKKSVQIKEGLNKAKAVAFSSGFGDGVYNVTALIHDYKEYGKRIKEVRITLITDKECKMMKTVCERQRK